MQSPMMRGQAAHNSNSARGTILYSVLIEFWLTDGDEPVPLPPATNQSSQELADAWKSSNSLRFASFLKQAKEMYSQQLQLVLQPRCAYSIFEVSHYARVPTELTQ